MLPFPNTHKQNDFYIVHKISFVYLIIKCYIEFKHVLLRYIENRQKC